MLEGELLKLVKCVRLRSDCALSDSVSGHHHEWVFIPILFASLSLWLKLCSHLTFAFAFASRSPSGLTLCQCKRKHKRTEWV